MPRTPGSTKKKTSPDSKTRRTAGATSAPARARKTAPARQAERHLGDVIGLGRARVPKDVPRATSDRGGKPKGIEIPARRRKSAGRPARVKM